MVHEFCVGDGGGASWASPLLGCSCVYGANYGVGAGFAALWVLWFMSLSRIFGFLPPFALVSKKAGSGLFGKGYPQ